MNRNYKLIKRGIIITSILFGSLLVLFTVDVINEVPDWAWFQINFDSSRVANYGTLISGLLSFLAILFVIFGIAEQREQLEIEKNERDGEVIQDYKNRLKLLNSLLVKIIDDISEQGKRMKDFFEAELQNPTQPNMTHFSANKSFNRILEMDYLMNYQSIEHFFGTEENWEKMFLNLNSNVDFYSECLVEHRQKYQNHVEDKVKRHQEIASLCAEFLDNCVKIIEKYRSELGVEDYFNEEWVIVFNNFVPAYYEYMEECARNRESTNFRKLSDDFFLPFLQTAMNLRNDIGFDSYGSQEQVNLASKIRKKIYEVEMYSLQYANNIKYYYEEYFDEECESYKNFKSIQVKIKEKL